MKVLIVDDNPQIRNLLREYLPASASDVFECSDGSEAMSSFREHRPDWVLMDQDMPVVDGITAIREIIAEFPKANICMVTAFDDEDLRAEALAAGASGFVVKDSLYQIEDILVSEIEH
ncbi:MAG: response regulator transcription factor [Pyrinomonadaceae bacterium]